MANILTQEDENDKNQQTSGLMGQGDSGTSTGGGPSTAQNTAVQSAQPRPQGSGRFTNLQKYLGANQKAGEDLAGGIRQKGEGYMGKVREGVEAAQNVQQGIRGEKARIGQAGQLAQNIQDDAVSVAQNNLQDVTQLRLGQNQATQLQGTGQQAIQNLNQNIDPLQQFGQNLGTESGRFQVLQDTFGGAYRPNYNMGQRRLDQLFLQADGSDQLDRLGTDIGQTVTSAEQSRGQLGRDLGQGIQDIRGGATQAQRDILNAIGTFDPDGRGAFGSLYGDFGTEQQSRRDELQQNVDLARGQFGAGTLNQDVADMLGFTGSENVSDLDLADYASRNINLGDTDVTMADVVGRADLDPRLTALSQLAGTDRDSYDLGTAEGQDIAFDSGKFSRDAAERRRTYEDRYFDKDVYKMLGPDTFGEDYYSSVVDSGRTIGDFIGEHNASGPYSPINWYNRLADPTSREQIVEAISGIDEKRAAGWIGGLNPDRFNKLLEMFDQQRNRNFGIGDVPDDLESGGNFNVS